MESSLPSTVAFPIATASTARPTGKVRDIRPAAVSHAAPRPHPVAKPTIAGQVSLARSRALATSDRLRPTITSPISIMKRVMLVVMTAVDGTPLERYLPQCILHGHSRDAEHSRKDRPRCVRLQARTG